MRRGVLLIAALGGVLLMQAPCARGEDGFNEKVMEWRSMFGVVAPFTGAANAIRGVNGGGLPWVLNRADGQLRADGDLLIQVRGLAIAPDAPSALAGINPAPFFLATVSCMDGAAMVANVRTMQAETKMIGDPRNGDAIIRAKVALPNPCVAPIVFVTSPGGSWFAVTGAAGTSRDDDDSEGSKQ